MRCRYIRLSAPLFVFCLLACSADDSATTSPLSNTNRNATLSLTLYTEPTTPVSVRDGAMHGLEIPSLRTGGADAFVVHTLPDGTLNYCIGYNTGLKAGCWTAYKWYNGFSSNNKVWNRNNWRNGHTFNGYGGTGDPFQPDPVLPAEVRTALADYIGSGHQRGHLLGSADRLNSKEANGQTFYLSNIHPQLPGFNEQGIWWNLENFLRDTYDTSTFRDTLYIVKGGTISEGKYRMTGNSGKLVCPNHFYMAILAYSAKMKSISGGYFAIAFWMDHKENAEAVSSRYAITIDELEQRTGIDFFCNLPDQIENAVEGSIDPTKWKLRD